MIAFADDDGGTRGCNVSGARQRWRAVAAVAADARQGKLEQAGPSRRLAGYEASIRGCRRG